MVTRVTTRRRLTRAKGHPVFPMRSSLLLALLLALGATACARADVTLAPLFTDHAVLQRDRLIPVWGKATAGETVSVTFHGQTVNNVAAGDGRWSVLLPISAASADGADLVVAGQNNTLTCHDVVVGEVWLCSGQSNMEFALNRAQDAAAEIAAANYPRIRAVKVTRNRADEPVDTVPTSGWQTATPATAGAFTAVGYFFARDLQAKLGVPIGLIDSTWGGTPIEAWMSSAALQSDPAFAVVDERWKKVLADYPEAKVRSDREIAAWTAAEKAAAGAGAAKHAAFLKDHPKPREPLGPTSGSFPRGLFNGMINPLLPYGIRGVLWYQGETNAIRASEYHALFAAMIRNWRTHFANEELPFFWVNLANYKEPADKTGVSYALLREAQTETLSLPHTGQALAVDIGNPNDIHPTNKQEVGRRLALLAKNEVYDIPADDTGPTFAGVTVEGNALRVRFTHANNGLVAHDRPVQSLEIAGADKKFYPATAKIEHDTLLVSSPQVPAPVAVRYAWSNSPVANLYNGSGLPAVPFRSANW